MDSRATVVSAAVTTTGEEEVLEKTATTSEAELSVVLAEEDAEVSSREMVETDPGECATTSRTEAATEETLADSLTTK